MTPDFRKLAAPLVAQASSFVAVLVIGVFIAHSSPARPVLSPSVPASSPGVSPSVTPPVVTPPPESGLYVRAYANGKHLAGEHQVVVLSDQTLASLGTGSMTDGVAALPTVSSPYLVCLNAPGLQSADAESVPVPAGWICSPVQAEGNVSVTFKLRGVSS
jgi:hypothetical protein